MRRDGSGGMPDAQGGGQGACFGFDVHSPLLLRFLRYGSGEKLHVSRSSREGIDPQDELVCEWFPAAETPFHTQLYRSGHLYRARIVSSESWFVIDTRARRIDLPATGDLVQREQQLWGLPAVLCFRDRGDLPLHAAAAQVGRTAVILAAPGRFGKTTLAAGFHKSGHRVLSEDMTCVRLSPEPAVIPGPAMLRVRRDVFDALTLPDVLPVAENDERVIVAMDPARRGDCHPVPISAIVLLRTASADHSLNRVPASEGIRDLWALSFKIRTESEQAQAFGGIAELVKHVSVFSLDRPLSVTDISTTVEQIVSLLPRS